MNVRSSNDVSCYPASSEVDSNHGNPCSLVGKSLFSKSGNTPGGAQIATQSRKPTSPESPDFAVFPCMFPANQGFAPRGEFAADCTLRHLVCDPGEFAPGAGIRRRISRDSAGFWVSVWAPPKRRHPGGALDHPTTAGFLCGRLRRFGIRVYGIVLCDETPPRC